MSRTEELIIGLMSGTSVDGIDAALVSFSSPSQLEVVTTEFTPFPEDLRGEINDTALNNSNLFHNTDSPLHATLAQHYASAAMNLIAKAGIPNTAIRAIANHGQTVRHEPEADEPFSLQLGDAQLIADQTGIHTISQFRQADIAAGGQGAPLMPAFHNALFGQAAHTFVLNLGGIANISQLGDPVIGFDTGPSNCLMDQWVEQHLGQRYDEGGNWAKSGRVIEELLDCLMTDPYLQHPYPKSTGTDHFNLDWLNRRFPELSQHSPADVQATLLAFTVKSVSLALEQLNAEQGNLYVCGGGAQNPALINALKDELEGFSVEKTDVLGVPADWVEAAGFAWLGYCHLHGVPSNLPSVTGASENLVLGESFIPGA